MKKSEIAYPIPKRKFILTSHSLDTFFTFNVCEEVDMIYQQLRENT